MISLIVAAAENGVIGDSNQLPWYLPADLKHFKEITTGYPIIMGRKTHESIGRALPNRRNIVVTSQGGYKAEDCEVVHSLDEALELVKDEAEAFVIGGASIYEQALPHVDKIYLTKVHAKIEGDTVFTFDESQWQQTSREDHEADEKNQFPYSFITLERKK